MTALRHLTFNEQLTFGFDAADNLHSRTNAAFSQSFTVDAANELSSVSRNSTFTFTGALPAPATNVTVDGLPAQTYSDFTFARTNLTLTSGNNSFTNVAENAYGLTTNDTFTVSLPSSVSLSYDNNGNLTNDGTRTFDDSENQLTNIQIASQWRSDFIYDGLHRRRIERDYNWSGSAWVKTNEARYICDGLQILQECDTNNNVLVTYTRGLDLSHSLSGAGGIGGLLARTDTNGSTFYHSDGSGNITALMDGRQNISGRYLYDPFGRPLGQWGLMAGINEMRFASMLNRGGISFYPFRAYVPSLQRWLNQDPIQEMGGINLYEFVRNDPLAFIDRFGFQTAESDPKLDVAPSEPSVPLYAKGTMPPDELLSEENRLLYGDGGQATGIGSSEPVPVTPEEDAQSTADMLANLGESYDLYPGAEEDSVDPDSKDEEPAKLEEGKLEIKNISCPAQRRTPEENRKARNQFKNNKDVARKAWEDRSGQKWPTDANGNPWPAEHPPALKEGGDPMTVYPRDPSTDPHNIPGEDGLTDYQRWGAEGTPARQANAAGQ